MTIPPIDVSRLNLSHAAALEAFQWWMKGFEAGSNGETHGITPILAIIRDLPEIIRDIIQKRDI